MTEDVVRARRFELVDFHERTRAALYMEGGQPMLGLQDEDEKLRVMVSINREGNPTLLFRGVDGKDRIRLSAFENGTGFSLSDPTDTHRIDLLIDQDGTVAINVQEQEQQRVVGTVVPNGAVQLALWDAEGNVTHGFVQGE